jgi:quinol monooxygenase YgiN
MSKFKIAAGIAVALMVAAPAAAADKYGVIAHVSAQAGKRDAMIDGLKGLIGMPGCINFVVAKDGKNPDAVWITEVWESKEAHDSALKTDQFKAAIGKAGPLMAGAPDQNNETWPVAGIGLK